MGELIGFGDLTYEFIAIVQEGDFSVGCIGRLEELAEDPQIIEEIAERYWEVKIEMDSEGEENSLKQDPYFRAGQLLIGPLSKYAVWPSEAELISRFGFIEPDFEGLSDSDIVRLRLEAIGTLQGSYKEETIGTHFRRPLSRFGGFSRLDLVRDGQFDAVRKYDGSNLIGDAT